MKEQINNILLSMQSGTICVGQASDQLEDMLKLQDRKIDAAYMLGVFNIGGIDGLHKEIQRLYQLNTTPHVIINSAIL